MPPVIPPSTQWFANKLRWMTQMIRKLMMQQSGTYAKPGVTGTRPSTYTPGVNTPVMNVGQIPATAQTQSRRYGLQTIDPQGKQRLMVGEQSDGTHGLWVYSAKTGTAVLKVGQLTSATTPEFGMIVEDPTGTKQVQLGQQPGGGYGLSVLNAAGKMARVSAPVSDDVSTELTTSATSPTTIGGPSVTVTVGEAGQALVIASSEVGIDGGTTASYKQGFVDVQVDGSGTSTTLIGVAQSPVTGKLSGIQVTATNARVWTGLSQGSHTFKCLYMSMNGQPVHFTLNSLIVIPY